MSDRVTTRSPGPSPAGGRTPGPEHGAGAAGPAGLLQVRWTRACVENPTVFLPVVGAAVAGLLVVVRLAGAPGAGRLPLAWIGCVILAIVGIAYLDWLADFRREKRLPVICAAFGFSFRPVVLPAECLAAWASFPLFRRGTWRFGPFGNDSRKCKNWLEGTFRGERVVALDFSIPNGRTEEKQTVAVFPDPVPGLPDFQLSPTEDRSRFWSRDLLASFGLRRPGLFEEERFGQLYDLEGDRPAELEERFSPGLRELLAADPGWAVQARDGRLVVFQPGKRCRAESLPAFLATACRVRRALGGPDVEADSRGATTVTAITAREGVRDDPPSAGPTGRDP